MSEVVLDASALLAVFNGEPGSDRVIEALPEAVISAVNLAEVATKLQERGMPDDRIRANIEALELTVIPLEMGLAIDTGLLRAATRSAGLSLGDRACLALAGSLGATAVTTDRAWQDLDIGIAIELAR
ncbi:VapC toxin family PIN domain ribonuclease [Sphingobium sp. LB126]|uniref:type II toxin-antitoxin system VapC family toxin n=1 Tax=Sphingobium sp. LB126 TaxID=1983755 RepID=UPI000C1FE6AB|nr:type II toxin-antitoxin system VapC family toxin [Sphingobium sp. LB126]PJG45603.1 VapC toxin family PIN domain ribonuclease [Sphingobium sp. LB126]